ncbi:response regulator [Flavobacterium sp.]|uniref:response regulator transcription factor n=1 Tax=Flavobacterium sp. TaxID=239 RepID=UPI003A92DF29
MKENYKIIIVDDHQLFADGMVRILADEDDFEVIGICNNSTELYHMLNNHKPDLIMLDIQMGGTNGLELCGDLKKTMPQIKIILISMFESLNVVNEGKNSGANGYIPKTTDAALVKKSIREVMEGKDIFIKPVNPETKVDLEGGSYAFLLSKREREIILYVKKGFTSKATAEELNISQFTVDTHRKNILRKLKLNSLKELISYAYENNL